MSKQRTEVRSQKSEVKRDDLSSVLCLLSSVLCPLSSFRLPRDHQVNPHRQDVGVVADEGAIGFVDETPVAL